MQPYEYISHIVSDVAGEILPHVFDYQVFQNTRWEADNEDSLHSITPVFDLDRQDPEQRDQKFFYWDSTLLRWQHSSSKYSKITGKPVEAIYDHSFEPLNYELDKDLWYLPEVYLENGRKRNSGKIVLHSEIGTEPDKIKQQGWVPVYWFSHAYLCSEFYFRHYRKLKMVTNYSCRPIVYPWLSTNRLLRQHRVDFLELLDLTKGCYSLLNPDPNGLTFSGPVPARSFDEHGNHSAEIKMDALTPWNTSFLHVVSETVWQDRIHFTEKIFKPVVLHQPFVVLQAPGSLEYLRSYGFQTFGNWWDESYDNIQDPNERLRAIADIVNWIATQDLYSMREEMSGVLEHNFRHFYENIPDLVLNELRANLGKVVLPSDQNVI